MREMPNGLLLQRGEIGFHMSSDGDTNVSVEECQETAWNHHHRAECAILAELNTRYVRTENCPSLAWGVTYRAVIRYQALFLKNMISDEDLEAFKALCTIGNIVEEEGEYLDGGMKSLVSLLEATLQIQVSAFDMMKFIDKFKANRVNYSMPILKSDISNLPSNQNFSHSGYCLEPFIALINHCCEPNAHYVFEGTELRVRASRDITKGEEVTFSYLGQVGDYEGRRKLLQRLWRIRCTCSICTGCLWNDDFGFGRSIGALEILRTSIRGVYMSRPPPLPDSLIFAIGVLEQSKHNGYCIPALLEAHELLVLLHVNAGNVEEALKVALKTRFLIEQQQKPKIQLKDRLGTLFNIILLLQSPNQPEEIFAGRLVVDFLRRIYLGDIRKCFGDDSMVFRHEEASLNRYHKELQDSIRADKNWTNEGWWQMTVAIPGENERRYVENMNKVLAWAGLQPLTDDQC